MLNIKIPVELSSMPAEDRAKGRTLDIRSKAISLSQGENGVIEWCKKVRNNLNKFYTKNALKSPFSN